MSRESEIEVEVEVDVACTHSGTPSVASIENWVRRAVRAASKNTGERVEVSVRVVDRDEIHGLNRDYRHCDKPTDVLSFPAGDIEGLPEVAGRMLGDIVACAPVIADEAADQRKATGDHWAHVIVHGTLHLLGYEHEDEGDAAAMETLEVAILAGLGIADPYVSQTDTIA